MNIDCPFCRPVEVVPENALSYALRERFPVGTGHLLVQSY
jgi:diadenosine tetraphosphate (Ap4A) HIT family hydrolase